MHRTAAAALLSTLLAAGCVGGAPREYRQSARPVAPPFNPTTDAPHRIGHPVYVPEAYPRSPHKRELPPTREPGIWASEAPPVDGRPRLMDLLVPLPEKPTEEEIGIARACSNHVNKAAAQVYLGGSADAARHCAGLRLYLLCLKNIERREAGRAVRLAALARLIKPAAASISHVCALVPERPHTQHVLDLLAPHLPRDWIAE